MDLLSNYPEIREHIEISFHDLMSEFNLKLTSPFEGCYLLIGEKCKIKFTYDRGVYVVPFSKLRIYHITWVTTFHWSIDSYIPMTNIIMAQQKEYLL